MFDITKLDDWCVDKWREAHRWASVRWAAIGAVVLPLMQMVPHFPAEIQALLPVWLRAPVAGAWCLIFIVLRMRAQKGLNNGSSR